MKTSSNISPKLKQFITNFYKASDSPPPATAADPYLDYFTSSSPLLMGLKKVTGHEEITGLRKAMWEKVTNRHHVVNNVAEIEPNQILLNGYVDYTLINGKAVTTDWAGFMKLVEEGDSYKMEYYQVYLDPSAAAKALSE
ncbi:hypothetical protein SBY92_003293 [Candida maltosa Xu316]|uniref:SnoaL-like domain-containing protein n=1 Tax=Candida maltosa (strain Xu316) TaxID=1245528 RepID=M3IPK1_CANMX|nr:hypothetical protein G210_1049 [Candida maltosa Xu316]